MTSKQEKLAAARKRLKEFQGKSKEVQISKEKTVTDVLAPKISRDGVPQSESVGRSSPLLGVSGSDNSKNHQSSIQSYQGLQFVSKEATAENDNGRKTPGSLSNEGNFSKSLPECDNYNQNLLYGYPGKVEEEKPEIPASDYANGLKRNFPKSVGGNNSDIRSCSNNLKEENLILSERDHGDAKRSLYQSDTGMAWVEPKKFFDGDVSNKSALSETIKSLQAELQSHAQTITILVQQRNDAQTALAEAQSLLNKKSGEAAGLGQQIAHLTSSVNALTHRLLDAEAVTQKLSAEKEENLKKWDESRTFTENVQAQLSQKEEEFKEMKKKYEEKSNDCQQLLASLQEAQGQLSFYQIQQQQSSNEGLSGPAVQISELQTDNVNLKKVIEGLKKELEAESAEKEESSQKFHIYAQQCNAQLSSLNSQLKSLKLENENLSKENNMLSKSVLELENSRATPPPCQSYEAEIADLHDQLNSLSEENKKLSSDLKKKEEKCAHLNNIIEEKELELSKSYNAVRELREENKKLASEAETPKASERLLATMESDKIAAAKAVSQNQKLKNQVIELEQAFIKLSEEKLELTNQLAHEKHVNGELQTRLRNAESDNHDDHHGECRHGQEEAEPLVNDSNEVEELRSIVRQLQDDKMELTARLNLYEATKREDVKEREKEEGGDGDGEGEGEENGTQCENTKVLLQQMKEKVRRTMNEIAVLDEEKEKLEHLVMQLQGETETIGEYITLYQRQRMLLRQRAQEKDSQLLQLSKDKEELKCKLSALDELVQRLIAERENISIPPGSKIPNLNSSAQIPENTAGKIRALISEIGSTTLINNQSFAFEHCSCCSGRLITI